MGIICTTSQKPTEKMKQTSKKIAELVDGKYVPRKNLGSLNRHTYVLVVTKSAVNAYNNGKKFTFHPSMAMLRIKRIDNNEIDTFTKLLGDISGWRVLDCTLGLGADTLVLSKLVGNTGFVTSLEKSKIIYQVVKSGFENIIYNYPELYSLSRNVRLTNIDFNRYLDNVERNSYDLIYFDPMFQKPLENSAAISSLRGIAHSSRNLRQSITKAKRVAKEAVVVKNNKNYPFNSIGLDNTFTLPSSSVSYGIYIKKED
ncbi:class I SAM-dependent methyltransferase [Proteinivorax tanatarense]|uniref:Class I SAM-dependent methyltransferase n=1 Tax=Proteinivorax tanatarense TaxID=1260629 RepID=A0AAU7VQV6_9FIRM